MLHGGQFGPEIMIFSSIVFLVASCALKNINILLKPSLKK